MFSVNMSKCQLQMWLLIWKRRPHSKTAEQVSSAYIPNVKYISTSLCVCLIPRMRPSSPSDTRIKEGENANFLRGEPDIVLVNNFLPTK